MSLILTTLGFSVVCVGVLGLLSPRRLRDLSASGQTRSRFRSAVMMRILLGACLIAAAPSSRFPDTVTVLGITALLLAIGVYRLGMRRFESIAHFWSNRPPVTVRAVSMVAVAFGLFLFYAPA